MSIQTDDFAPPPASRVVSAAPSSPNEEAVERALRPKLLQEYVGQAKAREQLEIFIGAARHRRRGAWAVPHHHCARRAAIGPAHGQCPQTCPEIPEYP